MVSCAAIASVFCVTSAYASTADAEGTCGDGSHTCTNEVCCMNGSALMFCCPTNYPVCNLSKRTCSSRFEMDVIEGAEPLPRAEPEAKVEAKVEADVESTCGDGRGHCTDEVCCMNGSALMFCCPTNYPVCNLSSKTCSSRFENDVIHGANPIPNDDTEPEVKTPEAEPEVDAEGTCGDGSHTCTNEVCCMNGSALMFCCPTNYPVCNLSQKTCSSRFENDVVHGADPTPKAEPEVKLEAETEGTCGDGSHTCTDEVCCMNGSALMFCCPTNYPVCNLSSRTCSSRFENDVINGADPTPKAEPEVKLEAETEGTCGDGSHTCTNEVCCMNGSALMFCCPTNYPVCNLSSRTCSSRFENDVVNGAEPEASSVMV